MWETPMESDGKERQQQPSLFWEDAQSSAPATHPNSASCPADTYMRLAPITLLQEDFPGPLA